MFAPPKHKKIALKSSILFPLDHEFLVQQVFALCNWDSFLVCFFLIFEVVKLCRMNLESPVDSTKRDTSFQTTYLFTLGSHWFLLIYESDAIDSNLFSLYSI